MHLAADPKERTALSSPLSESVLSVSSGLKPVGEKTSDVGII